LVVTPFVSALFFFCNPDGRGAELLDTLGEIDAYLGPPWSHCRREIEHFESRRIDAHVLQELFYMMNPSCCIGITFQVMTLSLESTGDEDAVNALFEGPKHIDVIELSRAGHADDLDARWVSKAHDPGQVCRGKRAVMASQGDNVRLPTLAYFVGLLDCRNRFLYRRFSNCRH
jgi:hypothetical protein